LSTAVLVSQGLSIFLLLRLFSVENGILEMVFSLSAALDQAQLTE